MMKVKQFGKLKYSRNKLLSFEQYICLGDTEEFKVNKTRESRRMAKEVKKQQRNEANGSKVSAPVEINITKSVDIKEEKTTPGDIEIKCKIEFRLFKRLNNLLLI